MSYIDAERYRSRMGKIEGSGLMLFVIAMTRGFFSGAAVRLVFAAAALFVPAALSWGQPVWQIPGEPMYTIEYQWLHLQFTFLDSSQSDTIWSVVRGDTDVIAIRFFRFVLPTPPQECDAYSFEAGTVFLNGDQPTGVIFRLFPRDSTATDTFCYDDPYSYWASLYTYQQCPLGELALHQVPTSGDGSYDAWLLAHERPATGEIIVGLMPFRRECHWIHHITLTWTTSLGGVGGESPLPESFSVSPCFPNPFNGATTFTVTLTRPGPVKVTVYNVLGQRVQTVIQAALSAGTHPITWQPSQLASGSYIVQVSLPGECRSQRVCYQK